MQAACCEYAPIVVKRRIQLGLRKAPPPAADFTCRPGDQKYVCREKASCWTGPHVVESAEGKDVRVHLGERTGPRAFNLSQTKPEPTTVRVTFAGSVNFAREQAHVYLTIKYTAFCLAIIVKSPSYFKVTLPQLRLESGGLSSEIMKCTS